MNPIVCQQQMHAMSHYSHTTWRWLVPIRWVVRLLLSFVVDCMRPRGPSISRSCKCPPFCRTVHSAAEVIAQAYGNHYESIGLLSSTSPSMPRSWCGRTAYIPHKVLHDYHSRVVACEKCGRLRHCSPAPRTPSQSWTHLVLSQSTRQPHMSAKTGFA